MRRLVACLSFAALLTAAPQRQTTGFRNIAVIPVDLSEPLRNLAHDALFGKPHSIDAFWSENSYGTIHASGQVLAPISKRQCGQIDLPKHLDPYQHVIYLYPSTLCAQDGHSGDRISWLVFDPTGPLPDEAEVLRRALRQLGHNLGVDSAESRWTEAGGHYAGVQKRMLGWLPDANVAMAERAGTYRILPLEEPAKDGTGIQLLRIPRNNGGWLALEFRRPTGFDQGVAPTPDDYNGVLLYVEPTSTSPLVQLESKPLPHRAPRVTLRPGDTFQDPDSHYSITVDRIGSEAFVTLKGGPPSISCITDVQPRLLSFENPKGGSLSLSITSPQDCAWTLTGLPAWATASATSGKGSATLTVTASANSGARRTIGIQAGDLTVYLAQNAVFCSPVITPATSPTFNWPGGYTNISLNTWSECAWTPVVNDSWISLSYPPPGGIIQLYVPPYNGIQPRTGTVTVGGAVHTIRQVPQQTGLTFVPVSPCRLFDTRVAGGPLAALETRSFDLRNSPCSIPTNAAAYAVNLTVVPKGPLGYITMFPSGQTRPVVSTLNSVDGRVKANAAIVPAGSQGAVSLYATESTEAILDLNGYFVPTGGLVYYPLSPCRLADTRLTTKLAAGETRRFGIRSAPNCAVSASAGAYSLNVTAIPKSRLDYLTVWPTGADQPTVSTLNALTGTITANSAIIKPGDTGEFNIYATHETDVVIDVNGYFGVQGSSVEAGMKFFPSTPCRVLDTRQTASGGPNFAALEERILPFTTSPCFIPLGASAVASNVTVVPNTVLGYLTIWPSNSTRPLASLLNAVDGSITSNGVIMTTYFGSINIYVTEPSAVLIDTSGYFSSLN